MRWHVLLVGIVAVVALAGPPVRAEEIQVFEVARIRYLAVPVDAQALPPAYVDAQGATRASPDIPATIPQATAVPVAGVFTVARQSMYSTTTVQVAASRRGPAYCPQCGRRLNKSEAAAMAARGTQPAARAYRVQWRT